MAFDEDLVRNHYQNYAKRVDAAKKQLVRPLTLSEKILFSHTDDPLDKIKRGASWLHFSPDRVSMQDATAQMAVLQFMLSGRQNVSVPTTIHCDHLIQAEEGAEPDLKRAQEESKEVFDFLQSASNKYGIGFWQPGAGIIHQVVLENYAFPGGMMIGTDSHTPNGGGLAMIAIGVGGADAVDVMAGMKWELLMPKLIGVKLSGSLSGWTSPKDVILKVASLLTVKGGTGYIIEYFGEGAASLSCTGKGTICNMGAEVGATTSIFPYDKNSSDYLQATERKEFARLADALHSYLQPDPEVLENPHKYYDQLIEINLTELEPHVNGPYTPDLAWKISDLAEAVKENGYPEKISVALIGSCTNSSYEDIERASWIAKQAAKLGLKAVCPLTITPGSERVRATIQRDGQLDSLERIGGLVLANACGPCIGQWKRHDVKFGEKNSILTSYNRNFSGRNDANPGTHSFVASPEVVIALSLAGKLTFNPLTDTLLNADGIAVKLDPPPKVDPLPKNGFIQEFSGYCPPAENGESVEVIIDPDSTRLHILTPFEPWNGGDFTDLKLLVKASGKCTTDHISPAGKWLRFRGHLDNISDNLFSGAFNAFHEQIGEGKNPFTEEMETFAKVARSLLKKHIGWIAVGEENYGEGSSREHAAMEPRHLGCKAVITKSFARIHETNLKKQGILPLTFQNKDDYSKILEDDTFDLLGIKELTPGSQVRMRVRHADGSEEIFLLNHSLNETQIEWFKAGSALNLIAKQNYTNS